MSVEEEKADEYLLAPNDIVFARTGNSTGRTYFYEESDGIFCYAGFLIKFTLNPPMFKLEVQFVKSVNCAFGQQTLKH